MKKKIQIILIAVIAFILGVLTPKVFLKTYYEQKRNDSIAYTLNVELNANINNLKDFDEGREDILKETLERNLNSSIRDAKTLLTQSRLSTGPKQVLSEKVAKAELALADRTITLDELLFSHKKP